MGSSERLQNEILLKEEAFLKEQRAKLTEQLNKLKVEEIALVKLLKQDNMNSHQTTMELFTKNPQVPSSSSQRIDSLELTETEVNHIPLQGLDTFEMNKEDYQGDEEEEEEEDDDDDDDDMQDDGTGYSQQLLNAISSMHYQNNHGGQEMSRSVLHSILQHEVGVLDEDDDEDYESYIH